MHQPGESLRSGVDRYAIVLLLASRILPAINALRHGVRLVDIRAF